MFPFSRALFHLTFLDHISDDCATRACTCSIIQTPEVKRVVFVRLIDYHGYKTFLPFQSICLQVQFLNRSVLCCKDEHYDVERSTIFTVPEIIVATEIVFKGEKVAWGRKSSRYISNWSRFQLFLRKKKPAEIGFVLPTILLSTPVNTYKSYTHLLADSCSNLARELLHQSDEIYTVRV